MKRNQKQEISLQRNSSFICLKKKVVLLNRSEEHHIMSQDRKQAYTQNK